MAKPPTSKSMEDWEEFFREKSRRRADKERLRSRRARRQIIIALFASSLFLVALIVALGVL